MYRNPKHSEGFKIIFIMFIIIAAVVIVAATALSDPDEAMKNLMLSAAMLLPTVFILYAVYCHFDNQEAQLEVSIDIANMLKKANGDISVESNSSVKNVDNNTAEAQPSEYYANNGWICQNCGSYIDDMYIQCPVCGVNRQYPAEQ